MKALLEVVARGFAALAAAILSGKADPGPTYWSRAERIAGWIETGERPR